MSSAPPKTRRFPWADTLVILVFAGLLALPTIDYFTHIDRTQAPDENRLLAPPPYLSRANLAGVQSYLSQTDSYFNDHFGFRNRLIRWYHQLKQRIFRTGRAEDNMVVGQHGWLYTTENRMVNHYLCLEQFTPGQMQAWQRLLEKLRDWLAARGIKYLFIVPPDKNSVYSEELPGWLINARPPGARSKLDQFLAYMKTNSTVEILDLRAPLTDGKKLAPTYLQNDTHWNWYGGFIASQEIIKTLARDFPELPPLRLEDFHWTNAPLAGGDLARSMGTPNLPEKYNYNFTPKPPLAAPEMTITNIIRMRNADDPMKINYLVVNTNLTAHPVDLVMFHDSYGKALRQFLGYSFHRSVFIWENKEFNPGIITTNHPQVVISEMLERYFNLEDPEEMMRVEAL